MAVASVRTAEAGGGLAEAVAVGLDRDALLRILHSLLLTRRLDERGHVLFKQGKLPGSFYTCKGNEAASVGVAAAMAPGDVAAPLHRNLGLHLYRGVEPWRVLCQYMGRMGGTTNGRDSNLRTQDITPGVGIFAGPSHLPSILPVAVGAALAFRVALNLNQSLRAHLSLRLHEYVASLVARKPAPIKEQEQLASLLAEEGHDLRISRDLETAKNYLRDRYAENPDARFGLAASSRDRDLVRFGIPNDFQATKRLRYGPWYGDDETAEGGRSCRHLRDCVTEFGAQGLELDAVLLAWGTDFMRDRLFPISWL